MSLFAFFLLLSSAIFFYRRSEKNHLAKAFTLLTIVLSLWCLFLFLGGISFPVWLRTLIANFTPVPTLFLPILTNYIVRNYTRPSDLVPLPKFLIIIHILAITIFASLSVAGYASPYHFDGENVSFRGGIPYFLSLSYIYFSLIGALGRITYNMWEGSYFVRLHSIYLFSGIFLACGISSIFLIILPLMGIYLNSLAALSILVFLWFSWIPITKYRLFNTALIDFGKDFRNPRLSSVIISINRFLLNRMDPIGFKEICDKYEALKREEVIAIQISEKPSIFSSKNELLKYFQNTSEKIVKLFLG